MIIFFLLIFLNTANLLVAKEEFLISNLHHNNNGICYFDNKIIIYGNTGDFIISEDLGKNWRREHVFTDTVSIIGMYESKEYLIGVRNDGMIFKINYQFKIEKQNQYLYGKEITSFNIFNDSLFSITTKDYQISLINHNLDKYYGLEVNTIGLSPYSTALNGTKYDIIAANDKAIIFYDKELMDLKVLKISDLQLGTNINKLLKINNEIYVNINGKLYKINENNLTFEPHNKDSVGGVLFFQNNFYCNISRNDDSKNKLGTIQFSQLINGIFQRRCILNYDFYLTRNFQITSVKEIQNKIIIAVGTNNSIFISFDGGFKWEIISYFNPDYTLRWINETIGYYASYNGEIFRTFDGGATFLPQRNNDTNLISINTTYPILFNMDSNGYGYCWSGYNNGGLDTNEIFNFLITNDFGVTYQKKWINGILPKYGIGTYHEGSYNTLVHNSFTIHNLVNDIGNYTILMKVDPQSLFSDNPKVEIKKIDSTLLFLTSIVNNKIWAYSVKNNERSFASASVDLLDDWNSEHTFSYTSNSKDNNINLLKLSMLKNITDSTFQRPFLFSLIDSVNNIEPTVDIYTGSIIKGDIKKFEIHSHYYVDLTNLFVKLIFKDTLDYEANIKGNLFHGYELNVKPGFIKTSFKLPFLINDNKAFFNNKELNSNSNESSSYCKIENIRDFEWAFHLEIIELNDLKKYRRIPVSSIDWSYFQKISENKFVSDKLILEKGETINKVQETEKKDVYMYKYLPYPQPGSNQINVKIYTNNFDCFNPKTFVVYNSNGTVVSTENEFGITQTGIYEAEIVWDCSKQQSGVYFIKLNCETYNDVIKVIKN